MLLMKLNLLLTLILVKTPLSKRFCKEMFTKPNVLCWNIRLGIKTIGFIYGQYINTQDVKFFHVNILARLPEYPGLDIFKNMTEPFQYLRIKFPHVGYLTLNVRINDTRMIKLYEKHEFIGGDYGEVCGNKTRFYYKNINLYADTEPTLELYMANKSK